MCAKEGVGLESPGRPYISTPDGLLWTKGAFVDKFVKFVKFLLLGVEIETENPPHPPHPPQFCCVLFQRDFSVTWVWLQFGLFGALCIMGLNW